MQLGVNILESIRYLIDQVGHPVEESGVPLLSIGTKAASTILMKKPETEDRVIIASIVFPFVFGRPEQEEFQSVFGQKVYEMVQLAADLGKLKGKKLQRLELGDTRVKLENARTIRLAYTVAMLDYGLLERLPTEEREDLFSLTSTDEKLGPLITSYIGE